VLERYANRLARSLAHAINIVDHDAVVLGGGMSNVDELYELVPSQLASCVFGHEAESPIVGSKHGDSSGVQCELATVLNSQSRVVHNAK
jgi:fructokinase